LSAQVLVLTVTILLSNYALHSESSVNVETAVNVERNHSQTHMLQIPVDLLLYQIRSNDSDGIQGETPKNPSSRRFEDNIGETPNYSAISLSTLCEEQHADPEICKIKLDLLDKCSMWYPNSKFQNGIQNYRGYPLVEFTSVRPRSNLTKTIPDESRRILARNQSPIQALALRRYLYLSFQTH